MIFTDGLLQSITTDPAQGITDIASQARTIAADSQSRISVVFPDAKFDALVSEVANIKQTIGSIQDMQVAHLLEVQTIGDGIKTLAKNSSKMLSKADEIKRALL